MVMTCARLMVAAVILGAFLPAAAAALQVWSGRTFVFTKPNGADWTLPENQDRITASTWLTRASNHGLFNIAQEDTYTTLVSPLNTAWATGNAVDWPSLTFAPWQTWNGSFPPSMVGVDAVVHLISDDIYLDIRFESWTSGFGGGGFAYARATAPPVAVDDPPHADLGLRAAPNPFNPATVLRFALARAGRARLALYDSRGLRVRTLVDEELAEGAQAVRWDGRDDAGRAVAAGTYVARLRTDDGTGTEVLTLVK
jgi:hypothetical protein